MNYSEMFKKSFSSVSPVKNDKELLKSVLERTEKMENKKKMSLKKPLIAVCAAVIAITMATVTVGAANDWDYVGMFKIIFGDKAENINENIVSESSIIKNELDYVDIKLVAAAADMHGVMAIIDVTGKNDYKVCESFEDVYLRYTFAENHGFIMDWDGNAEATCTSSGVIEANENFLRICIRMTTSANTQNNGIHLTVHNSDWSKRWETVFKADFSDKKAVYEINTDFNISVTSIPYDPEKISKEKATVSQLSASPISLYLAGEFPLNFFIADYENSYVVMDNDEKVGFGSSGSLDDSVNDEPYKSISIELKEPINPEEIASLVIDGEIIEIG